MALSWLADPITVVDRRAEAGAVNAITSGGAT
jgi:hypothetical protein